MSINKLRSKLYKSAQVLGDIQAVKSGDPKKIAKRAARKVAGKESGKLLNKIFK